MAIVSASMNPLVEPPQCQVKSVTTSWQCPNLASFRLEGEPICRQCAPGWIERLVNRKGVAEVRRL